MNILYIDHYAGSPEMGMEFRPYYFAREWQKMGHKVRIVGASYSHLRKSNPDSSEDFEIQIVEGVEYQWIKTKEYNGNGIDRAITMLQFCSKLWLRAKKLVHEFKPDVVIASSTYPLDTFPAQRIKKQSRNKVLLVHEIHDMWPITPMELYGMSKSHPFVIVMQIGENSFCKKADLVVSVLPCAENYLKEHGLGENKFLSIENGIVLQEWNDAEKLPDLHMQKIEEAKQSGKKVIGFYGSHTKSYCIENLIKALKEANEETLFAVFVGEGDYKQELIDFAEEIGLEESSYAFLPAINKRSIPSLINELDATYIGAMRNKMFEFGIGMNKLFDAMMGGKPIIYAVDAPNNYIDDYNCGISVVAEDVEALTDALHRFCNLSEEEKMNMGNNGHNAIIENYNYDVLAQKFIEGIEKRKG